MTTASLAPLCEPGWANLDDDPANGCETNNCENGGECIDGINEYTCDCSGTGYQGTLCDTDVDECFEGTDNCDDNPAATCTNTTGSLYCTCPDGTTDVNEDGTVCEPAGCTADTAVDMATINETCLVPGNGCMKFSAPAGTGFVQIHGIPGTVTPPVAYRWSNTCTSWTDATGWPSAYQTQTFPTDCNPVVIDLDDAQPEDDIEFQWWYGG
jgi:hypothetical protein